MAHSPLVVAKATWPFRARRRPIDQRLSAHERQEPVVKGGPGRQEEAMSTQFRKVTDDFWVSPQIDADDVRAAAAQGFKLIINNRPDGETPGQPEGREIAEAAQAAGLGYVAVPMRGRPDADQARAVGDALKGVDGPVLGFCAGGMRSILVWGAAQVLSGERTREDVIALARAAGYDLSMAL
jgi:uncharacterized protein (TIGR01244 family)